jgi:hypothetical protein
VRDGDADGGGGRRWSAGKKKLMGWERVEGGKEVFFFLDLGT